MEPEAALAEHEIGKPFSFPREPRPMPRPDTVRVPALADFAPLLDWAFPLIQVRYPRVMKMPARQLLTHAATAPANPPMRVLRTENALGLAVAERDAFEPEWSVRVKLVVHRDAPDEAELVRAALHDWAKTIGAISVDDPVAAAAPERPAAVKMPAKRSARKQAKRTTRARRSVSAERRPLADQSHEDPERQAPSSFA